MATKPYLGTANPKLYLGNMSQQERDANQKLGMQVMQDYLAVKNAPENNDPGFVSNLGDLGKSFQAAAVNTVIGGPANTAKRIGLISESKANEISDQAQRVSNTILEEQSPFFKKQTRGKDINSLAVANSIISSTPGTLLGALGGVAGKALGSAGAVIGASAGEGVVAAQESAARGEYGVRSQNPKDLLSKDGFQRELAMIDKTLPQSERELIAQQNVARKLGSDTYNSTLATTGGTSLLTGGGAIGSLVSGKLGRNLLAGTAKAMAHEAGQEWVQSGLEQIDQNYAVKKNLDSNQALTEDALHAANMGAITGGVMGGGANVAATFMNKLMGKGTNEESEKLKNNKVLNPETNTPVNNADLVKAYKHYEGVMQAINTGDMQVNSDNYNTVLKESLDSIDAAVNPEPKKKADGTSEPVEVNPIDKRDAEALKNQILEAHKALGGIDNNSKQPEEASLPQSTVEDIPPIVTNNELSKEAEDKAIALWNEALGDSPKSTNEEVTRRPTVIPLTESPSTPIEPIESHIGSEKPPLFNNSTNEVKALPFKKDTISDVQDTSPTRGVSQNIGHPIESYRLIAESKFSTTTGDRVSFPIVPFKENNKTDDSSERPEILVSSTNSVLGNQEVSSNLVTKPIKSDLKVDEGYSSAKAKESNAIAESIINNVPYVPSEQEDSHVEIDNKVRETKNSILYGSWVTKNLNDRYEESVRLGAPNEELKAQYDKLSSLTTQEKAQEALTTLGEDIKLLKSAKMSTKDEVNYQKVLVKHLAALQGMQQAPAMKRTNRWTETNNIEDDNGNDGIESISFMTEDEGSSTPYGLSKTDTKQSDLIKTGLKRYKEDTEFGREVSEKERSDFARKIFESTNPEWREKFKTAFIAEDFASNKMLAAKAKGDPESYYSNVRGFFSTNKNGNELVAVNTKPLTTLNHVAGTVFHELAHYGVSNIFDNKGTAKDSLFQAVLNSSPKLREKIFDTALPKWKSYLDSYKPESEGEATYKYKDYNIPNKVALRYVDEYLAEGAKALMTDKKFVETAIGYGIPTSSSRIAIRTERNKALSAMSAKIRENAGLDHNIISDDHIINLIAHVADKTYYNLNRDLIPESPSETGNYWGFDVTPKQETSWYDNFLANPDNYAEEEIKYDVNDNSQPIASIAQPPIPNVQKFIKQMNTSYGDLATTVGSQSWSWLQNKFNNNGITKSFSTFGNLPFQEAYKGLSSVYMGHMEKSQKYVTSLAPNIQKLTPMQKAIAYNYFTDPKGDLESVKSISPLIKKQLEEAKKSISDLGQSLVNLGALNEASYESNKNSYLHTVYFKYLDQYKGTGKRPFLGEVKQKKVLSEMEKAMLGEIKDPGFLVPETIGIMARDHAVLSFFDAINQSSPETLWTLSDNTKYTFGGKKYTRDQALDIVNRGKDHLSIYDNHNNPNVFTVTDGRPDPTMEKYREEVSALEAQLADKSMYIDTQLSVAIQRAVERGEVPEGYDPKQYLADNYVQLGKEKHFGALGGSYVRKEIVNDLKEFTELFNVEKNASFMRKLLSPGGGLDTANRYFKTAVIGLNPGSWARNIAGNFALVDMNSSRATTTLTKWTYDEISGIFNDKPSKWWIRGENKGLFGATLSAVELADISRAYKKDLEKANHKAMMSSKNLGGLHKALFMADPRHNLFFKMVTEGTRENIAKAFSLLEGTFKVVAMKDYVTTWEEQNGISFEDLDNEQQEIILTKAANKANDSVFNYSQAPETVKFLRRNFLGAPFITFAYKAAGASVRSAIEHPVKFAKYLALPHALTALAMANNDWDDDDIDEFRKQLPEYYRHYSTAFFPFKDSANRPQIFPLDFLLPWSTWTNAARHAIDSVSEGGVSKVPASTLNALHDMGFMGGPVPNAMAAYLTGNNIYTGQPIQTPGAAPNQQLWESMVYGWDLMTPAWARSTGWLAHMKDTFLTENTNSFGELKYTPGQALGDITGMGTKPVNSISGNVNYLKEFSNHQREINRFKMKTVRDTSLSADEKASEISDANERLKMIRQKYFPQ